MKKLMYIFLVLSVLTGCKEKKDAGAMKGMPTLAISVAKPIVKDITLTKDTSARIFPSPAVSSASTEVCS